MRIVIFLVLLVTATIIGNAQVVWESCGGPSSSFVGTIAHTSNNYIYILNQDRVDTSAVGTLYRSADDGDTWEEIRVFSEGATKDFFSDRNDNLYLAYFSTLYISSDFGDTWIQKSMGETPCWLFHIGPSGNFYTASDTEISVSRDRGETWAKMTPPYNTRWIRSIAEDDNGDFYVCNNDRVLQRTSNLGFSWYEVHSPAWQKCDDVHRGPGGMYISSSYGFFRTTNHGESWQKLGPTNCASENEIVFNPTGGIVCRSYAHEDAALIASNDSGKTWNTLPPFPVEGARHYNVDIDNGSRVLAGTDAGLFILQPDSTWKRSFVRRGKEDEVRRILSLAPDRLLVAHEAGMSEYNPQTNTWTVSAVPVGFNEYIHTIVDGKNNTTVLGCSYHLVRTSDGGASWELGTTPHGTGMGSIYTDKEHNLYPLWLSSKSTDNGDTWESTGIQNTEYLTQDGEHNWYYIDIFQVLHVSKDAGRTWQHHQLSTFYTGEVYTYLEDRIVLLDWDTLRYSFDEGDTWSNAATPIAGHIRDLVMLPDGTIYAALAYQEDDHGVTRTVARSDDNGYTWVYDDEGLQQLYCYDLELHSDGRLYAATYNGMFRTTVPLGIGNEDGSIPGSLKLYDVYPNPVAAGESVSLHYTIATAQPISLTLYNTLGVAVYSTQPGRQSLGEHTLHIPTRGLAPGVYQCVLKSGNERAVQRLVVR